MQGRMGLPQRVHQVSPFHSQNAAASRMYAVVTPDEVRGTFDAEVLDEKGNCYLRLRGYQTVALSDAVDKGNLKSLQAIMQHFTYRPRDGGYEEETLYRGVHPMMGKRLHLWRLSNFKIERLPSVADVYLLHAVAHDNPKDERLFAAAEVRDVTPVRDDAGRVVQLPHLERMK